MQDLIIREFNNEDICCIQKLILQLTGNEIDDLSLKQRFKYFEQKEYEFLYIAENKKEVVGLLGLRIRENVEDETSYGEVTMLVVDESHRRKGLASKIMDFADNFAKEKGCIGLWLVSGFGREEHAHEFYKNYGFKITGYRFVKAFK